MSEVHNQDEEHMEQDPPVEEEEMEEEEEEEDDGMPALNIKLQNVVATVNFGCNLDLLKIANSVRNAEYNPSRFHAVIMRIRDPRTTALLFKSGKMIVTGAKNEKDNLNGARKYTAILQKLGMPVVFNDFKVQNITATFDCGFPIRLEAFLYDTENHNFSTYEPELFPGLIYRMPNPKVVLLIFVSGKVVLTGAKTNEVILEAVNDIFPRLTKHRKAKTVVSTAS